MLAPLAGIGLRAPHHAELLERLPPLGWLEVHAENYFGDGGAPLDFLQRLRAHYPLSLHCVGLSLGGTDALDAWHIRRLRALAARTEPALISDHLCWSAFAGVHFNDLLPLPYTQECLEHVAARVARVQDALGRQLAVENLSAYLRYAHSTIPEAQFLNALAERSGCALLLDVNNVHVSATNHGLDAAGFVRAIAPHHVVELHLAGHAVKTVPGGRLLLDDHGCAVSTEVWALYELALAHLGPRPTLIEWDANLPPLDTLLAEAEQAGHRLQAQPRQTDAATHRAGRAVPA